MAALTYSYNSNLLDLVVKARRLGSGIALRHVAIVAISAIVATREKIR